MPPGTRLGGDPGDPYQTLWGMRWLRDALAAGGNPFFTDRLYHPEGATLVFQTFALPSALLVAPLWGWLPEVAIYNLAVLAAFALSAYGMFWLARELTGDRPSALAAGVIFSAVPYHLAHLQGHLHLLSMGWVPLAVRSWLRVLGLTAAPPGRVRDGALGGLFLALGALASWYHLLFALIVAVVLLAHAAVTQPAVALTRASLRAAVAGGGVFLLLAGPLLAAMLLVLAQEPITGAHDPVTFSADLHAFVFPNAAQAWAQAFGARFTRWTGNTTENAAYVGVTLLMLGLVGAARNGRARTFLIVAVVGAVLEVRVRKLRLEDPAVDVEDGTERHRYERPRGRSRRTRRTARRSRPGGSCR